MKQIVRHIRNEWYRYLFDTVVVIVGILIAFALNNWNDKRKSRDLINTYANSLISDLRRDLKEVKTIKNQIEESIIRIDSLANYIRTKEINEISNLSLLPFTTGDNVYRPYSWNRETMEDLKISGALRFKGNEDLSKLIVEYVAKTKHMEEDYYGDLKIKEGLTELARGIVNLNYSNFEELSSYGNTNNPIKELDFSASEAYRTAEKEDLKLITEDMDKIHEFVNGNLQLRAFLVIRAKYELPNLIEMAENMIELLEKEYIN